MEIDPKLFPEPILEGKLKRNEGKPLLQVLCWTFLRLYYYPFIIHLRFFNSALGFHAFFQWHVFLLLVPTLILELYLTFSSIFPPYSSDGTWCQELITHSGLPVSATDGTMIRLNFCNPSIPSMYKLA